MQRRIHAAALAAGLGLALGAGPAAAQRIDVQPGPEVLLGTPLAVTAGDLAPGETVTLRSDRRLRGWDGQPVLYRAEARFTADGQGRVDLATARPLPGSAYAEPDVQGLFWSATPQRGPVPEDLPPGQVRLTLEAPGGAPVSLVLTLRDGDPAVASTPVPGFPGAVLVRPPGTAGDGPSRPAVITLGGSEGGGQTAALFARRLASHGFVAMSLPYHSPQRFGPQGPMPPELPELPQAFASIPLERLQAARDWLAAQPGVDGLRIGVYGASKGAEYALLAAVRMPWIRSVVAAVPSDVSWEGWGPGTTEGQSPSFSWQGRPVPFVPYVGMAQEMQGFTTGTPVRFRRVHDAGRAAHPERVAAARIPVEDFAGALLVIGGGGDQVWDSGGMAQAIVERRRAAGRDTEAVIHPAAGHAIVGTGWVPTTMHDAAPMKVGGRPAADAAAQAQGWVATLDFLRRTLGPLPR